MKKLITIALISLLLQALVLPQQTSAQTTNFEFTYDDAGNRIQRTVLELKSAEQQDNTTAQASAEDAFFNEKLGKYNLNVFPNPATSSINISISGDNSDEDMLIELRDLQGRLLSSQVAVLGTTKMDVSNHAAGAYILHIRIGEEISVWKIIKE
jgi:hypothetical protein